MALIPIRQPNAGASQWALLNSLSNSGQRGAENYLLHELMQQQTLDKQSSALEEEAMKAAGASLNPLPGMSMEQTMALMDQPGGIEAYQGMLADSREPVEPEGPLSSAGKIASDLGVDIRTPEGQAAVASVMKSGSSSVNVYNAPSGYRTTPEGNLEPIPGGPGEEVTGTGAAAMALGPGALADIPVLEQSLFHPDGSLNLAAVATMNTPGLGAIPNTAGVDLRQRMEAGIEAILRPISGATIPPEERQARRDMYYPSITDTADVARNKLAGYRRDLEGSMAAATRGRGEAPVATARPSAEPGFVDQLLQQGMSAIQGATGGGAPPAPAAPSTDDYGEGEIVLNPATGERRILQGGQWVPYSG